MTTKRKQFHGFNSNPLSDSIINVLGVVYSVLKTSDGGDLYLTEFGAKFPELLDPKNWFEKEWFESTRKRLLGTSTVYYVPTREIDGKSLELVVKYSRVGENVPIDTFTMSKFLSSEFNSPWEEFALVFEMCEGKYGPKHRKIYTQEPLGIYVPPEKMQLWQSGRSETKIRKIKASHPEIELDILRQYVMLYRWIRGKNTVEMIEGADMTSKKVTDFLSDINSRSVSDLASKGYEIHDMKPQHIVFHEQDISTDGNELEKNMSHVTSLMEEGKYSIIDYELLYRTEDYQAHVSDARRHSYLDDQRDRFKDHDLPPHMNPVKIFGVPYVHSIAESTGGELWVVGKNPRLVDYFLPERWRSTPKVKLSDSKEIYRTVTKDKVRLVWKVSSVGEIPERIEGDPLYEMKRELGYNSPFEEFAIALELDRLGIPVVYVRAIYRTGSTRNLPENADLSRFDTHSKVMGPEGEAVLKNNYNYISIRGFYNGSDDWVAKQDGRFYTPINSYSALKANVIDKKQYEEVLERVRAKLEDNGYISTLLQPNDVLITFDPAGHLVKEKDGSLEGRICNFEFLKRKTPFNS